MFEESTEAGTPVRTERRAHQRHRAAFRVEGAGDVRGTTRDLSVTGIYFRTPGNASVIRGQTLSLALRLDQEDPDNPIVVRGEAVVLRVERGPDGWGIAAGVKEWTLDGRIPQSH
jgi:PilZ domain